jgi:hypothetical protein
VEGRERAESLSISPPSKLDEGKAVEGRERAEPSSTPPPSKLDAEKAVETRERAAQLSTPSPGSLEKKSEETEGIVQPPTLAPPLSDVKEKQKTEETKKVEGMRLLSIPSHLDIVTEKGHKEKTSKKEEDMQLPQQQILAEGLPATPEMSMPLASYVRLDPQVMALYERMMGVIVVMSASDKTETTMTLNAPQFASSVFFGSQIIIQEYSTAPQTFNIQINGSPQAVALFQGNADDLMAAFQYGNQNFKVNRLEMGYLKGERHLVRGKEDLGGGADDQQQRGHG